MNGDQISYSIYDVSENKYYGWCYRHLKEALGQWTNFINVQDLVVLRHHGRKGLPVLQFIDNPTYRHYYDDYKKKLNSRVALDNYPVRLIPSEVR